MTARRRAGLLTAGWAVLAALVFLVYWPTLGSGLVWDDTTAIVAVRSRRGLGWAGIRWAFTRYVLGHFQPLTWLSLAVDDRLWGGRPIAYHFTNVALHAVNTLLVALVALVLFDRLQRLPRGFAEDSPAQAAGRRRSLGAALLTAAIFALHPLRVESVAWATERRDVLSAFFLLLSTLFYLRRETAPSPAGRRSFYGASLFANLLGLLSKAQITLPAVLLVLDFWPLRKLTAPDGRPAWRSVGRAIFEKLPFFALSAAFSVSAIKAQASSGALLTTQAHSIGARLVQAGYGLLFYLRATFATTSWYPLHERPVPLDPRDPHLLVPALAALSLTVLLVAGYRLRPALLASWAAYTILLLPVLGLAQSGVQLVADRYSYLACLSWAMLLAWGVSWAAGSSRRLGLRWVTLAVALVTLASWAAVSRRQTAVWQDEETLWHHTLSGGPSALAHLNLGILLSQHGLIDAAAEQLCGSLAVVPSYNRPWYTLQRLLETRGDEISPETARRLVPVLARALSLHRDVPVAHYVVGLDLERAGDTRLAFGAFSEALRLDPRFAPARREQRKMQERSAD